MELAHLWRLFCRGRGEHGNRPGEGAPVADGDRLRHPDQSHGRGGAQLEGAIQQGLGLALTENYQVNRDTGVVETTNYDSYKVPTALDMPKIDIRIVGKPDPKGPFGAKGVGESGTVGVAPAIANAIYDAVGVRMRELPITPERVLAALAEKKGCQENCFRD